MNMRDIISRRRSSWPSLHRVQDQTRRFWERVQHRYEAYMTDWDAKALFVPAANIVEGSDSFRIDIGLPGRPPEAVDISTVGGGLLIEGKAKETEDKKEEIWLSRELSFGPYRRQIQLPDTANCDKAEATFKEGILSIYVPKKADAVFHPKKLQIRKAA